MWACPGPGLTWVARFTLPFIPLVALEAAFVVLAAGLMTNGRAVLLSPAVVIVEWLRGVWPLGGLPLAMETGRTVVQATPTGYSAVIAPDGAVRSRFDPGASHVLVDDVAPRQGRTPYVVVRDVPVLVLAIAGLALATVPLRAG